MEIPIVPTNQQQNSLELFLFNNTNMAIHRLQIHRISRIQLHINHSIIKFPGIISFPTTHEHEIKIIEKRVRIRRRRHGIKW